MSPVNPEEQPLEAEATPPGLTLQALIEERISRLAAEQALNAKRHEAAVAIKAKCERDDLILGAKLTELRALLHTFDAGPAGEE